MNFSQKKLPREAASELRRCPIESVAPFALMIAPAYVYLKRNEKFVAVKAPLDFFAPDELQKMRPYENFFFPQFVDQALPFRDAAVSIKTMLNWKSPVAETKSKSFSALALPPTPYEISDAALKILGPLWGRNKWIETFFVCVFANEICDLLPREMCVAAREQSIERFEKALFVSSWQVFMACYLGYLNLDFLNRLRLNTFENIFAIYQSEELPEVRLRSELDELLFELLNQLKTNRFERIELGELGLWESRVGQKLQARLDRVVDQCLETAGPSPTVFGERGFVDV